jgi:hypothetical protein
MAIARYCWLEHSVARPVAQLRPEITPAIEVLIYP